MNKHKPKYECPTCHKIVWDFNDSKSEFKCKFCDTLIEKELHGICGAMIYKENRDYVLAFPEYNERAIYSDWDTLQIKMDELVKNEKGD